MATKVVKAAVRDGGKNTTLKVKTAEAGCDHKGCREWWHQLGVSNLSFGLALQARPC